MDINCNNNRIIHGTKNLASKLPTVNNQALSEQHALGSWHANFYTFKRRNCIMFCHDQTRFILFIAGFKKDDFARLDMLFANLFANTLLKLNYEPSLIEKALRQLTPLCFDSNTDRSVQATMRIAALDLEFRLEEVTDIMDLCFYRISADLSHRPVRTKGMKASECLWPNKAMRGLLENIR